MYGWSVNVGDRPANTDAARSTASEKARGLFAGTLVARATGWCPVENLSVGDRVWTFDHGLQTVVEIRRKLLWDERGPAPATVLIPQGALANARDILLLSDQGLLLECENACDRLGDPLAVIPAAALTGVVGIDRYEPSEPAELLTLVFADEEVIYIDSGLLLHCPSQSRFASDDESAYEIATLASARTLLTDLDLAELALREVDEEFFGERMPERVA